MANGDNITGLDAPVLNDQDYVQKIIDSFDATDDHDHTTGKGVAIPAGGIGADAITTVKILDGAVTNAKIAAATIDLTTKVTGVLPEANGGTGFDGSAAANGELPIGDGSGFTKATLTGTSNQLTVTNGAGSITLSTPQNIDTGASPSFVGATYSGLTASRPVVTDGSKGLSSALVDISDATNFITGTLSLGNGGTGQTTKVAAMDGLSPTTTKGDILVDDGTNVVRKAAGTNGYILSSDSGQSDGLNWIENTGGGGGGFIDPGAAETGNYSADGDDEGRVILVATSNGEITVTLPTPSAGFMIGVKDIDGQASTSPITIARNGSEEIDNASGNDVITDDYGCHMYVSDGTDWARWGHFLGVSVAGRAVWGGGNDGSESNVMDYVSIPTTGNATDFGDLTVARRFGSGASSASRGIFQGGTDSGGSSDVADYITVATTGNATDFGDLSAGRTQIAGASSSTRALAIGGDTSGAVNIIEYVTIASTGNYTDFGDTSVTRTTMGACESSTRAVGAGGDTGSSSNVMDYVAIASTGNATDFGDLTVARNSLGGFSSSTRGVFAGSFDSPTALNTIDYITIASTGNATDFGDLSETKGEVGSTSNKVRGLMGGGYNGSTSNNVIEYVTINTTGNTTDFGDLTVTRRQTGGCLSDAHGGL